jgi:hypothetical protein
MQPQEPNKQQPNTEQQPDLPDIAFSSEQSTANNSGQVFIPGGSPPAATPGKSGSNQPNVVPSGSFSQQNSSNKKSFKPSKKLALVALLPLLVAGSAAAAYFGYVAPNKPENVWNTALVNTGKGYDKAKGYVSSANFDKGIKLSGSFKAKSAGLAVDGNIEGTSDNKGNGQYSGGVSSTGLKANYEFRTVASTSSNPDIYFKVGGLEGLGELLGQYFGAANSPELSATTKAINGINNQWYFVDHTLLDQASSKDNGSGLASLTKKDVSDFLTAIGEPSKKYIFTSDQSKAAIEMKQFVGKETQDGLDLNHYKVGVNKANLKKWNKEVCDNLKNNKLYTTLSFGQSQEDAIKECYDTTEIDKLDNSRTADAWVDLHTKLIYKVRVTDSKNSKNYVDIIQKYKGGDTLPLAIAFNSDTDGEKTSGVINFVYDKSASSIKISGDFKVEGSQAASGNLNLTITPNTTEVKVEKPANAKNIMQLANDLGFSSLIQDSSTAPAPTLQ